MKRFRPAIEDKAIRLQRAILKKSSSNHTTLNSSAGDGLFQFDKTTKTTRIQPKDLQPDPMSDADKTPDLTCLSPMKKIKLEKFSEKHDIFHVDEDSFDSSNNSVIILETEPEEIIPIIDSADANREMLDSLQKNLDRISDESDEENDTEPAEPPFKQGTRYKDCDDCYKFYKEKSAKMEIVYELRSCRRQCPGYHSRVNEMKEARKAKSMPQPRKVYEHTPSGFWSLDMKKTDSLWWKLTNIKSYLPHVPHIFLIPVIKSIIKFNEITFSWTSSLDFVTSIGTTFRSLYLR